MWIVIRFVVFGIGGFVCLWIGCAWLMGSLVGLPIAFAGGLMMLFGGGAWKRWAYLWVFYSTPVVIIAMAIVSYYVPNWDRFVPGSWAPFFIAPMPISYWFVRRYYKRREVPQPSSKPAPQITHNEEGSR